MGRRSRKSKRRMNSLFMALLLTAVMLIMSTYAWFSANRAVAIEGITAKVSAAEGLQISLDGVNWGATVTVNEANLAAVKAYNKYIFPTELHPVSTVGATSGGEIQFYDGMVSSDGTTLTSAALATQTVYGADGTYNASNGKYIVFDVYLKNSSSNTETGDSLLLNTGTKADIGATSGKEGVRDTGLENSVRVGFALYPSTATFTAAQSDIVALTGDPLVSIWEPNYNTHIPEIYTNDSARVKTASSTFITAGLIGADTGTLSGVNGYGETANTFMKKISTVRTSGTLASQYFMTDVSGTVTASKEDTMDKVASAGTKLTLEANKISKLRVYIWLDGQDPDCIDTASTGKYLDFVLNLAKPGETDSPKTSVDE